jgi:hypothetical protein
MAFSYGEIDLPQRSADRSWEQDVRVASHNRDDQTPAGHENELGVACGC